MKGEDLAPLIGFILLALFVGLMAAICETLWVGYPFRWEYGENTGDILFFDQPVYRVGVDRSDWDDSVRVHSVIFPATILLNTICSAVVFAVVFLALASRLEDE